jgi:3-mercaptopyruvate sulfurtransferase SseA
VADRSRRWSKYRHVVLYCHCDEQGAARRAAFELQTLGFANVSVLEGGYRAWLDAGLPVEPARPAEETRKGLVLPGTKN